MSRNTGKQEELIQILERGGAHTVPELMDELDLDAIHVRHIIHALRKKAVKGKGSWIHTTSEGYSYTTTPAAIIKEANMRIKMCVGLYVNSAPVFGKAKKIASAQFEKLRIQHKPQILKISTLGA